MKVAKHKELYMKHRRHAKARGIPFLLSYEEWLKIWMDSGHWHERGKRKDQYCMGRFGDTGPYAVVNVKIITNSENSKEAKARYKHHSKETRAKLTAAMAKRRTEGRLNKKGYFKHTPESIMKMRGNKNKLGKYKNTIGGRSEKETKTEPEV